MLNKYIYDDDSIGQLFQTQIKSEYHDIISFAKKYKGNDDPLILSINIQSINSKYEALKAYVLQLHGLGIRADIILLQETWEEKFPKHFHLPGYQTLLARTRVGMRGGGIGFFVWEGLNFKERTYLDFHTEKTFENLVLEVSFPNKTIIISKIYRSPTPPRGIPMARHMESFLSTLDAHLSLLSELDKPVYVFLDVNINLLNIENNPVCTQYFDIIIANGFLQIISKATRIQNDKASLIDHVLSNTNMQQYQAGTLINDISDHLMNYTFILCTVPKRNNNLTPKPIQKRLINELNIANFKAALLHTNWAPVMREMDKNRRFNHFWNNVSTFMTPIAL